MKKYNAAIIVVSLVIAIVGIGILSVTMATDGTEKYNSVGESEAVAIALSNFDSMDEGIGTISGISKLRVAKAEYTPSIGCSNPTDANAYTITLETVWWFGITTPLKTDRICK